MASLLAKCSWVEFTYGTRVLIPDRMARLQDTQSLKNYAISILSKFDSMQEGELSSHYQVIHVDSKKKQAVVVFPFTNLIQNTVEWQNSEVLAGLAAKQHRMFDAMTLKIVGVNLYQ